MNKKSVKSIRLMVNRQETTIRVSDIVYAQVTDKLCTIYLIGHGPYRLFFTIASLEAMLPADGFLRISRNCLISLKYLQNVDSEYVYLSDGTLLPYSHRQKSVILHAFQRHLSVQAQQQDHSLWRMNIFDEFRCFDHCPFPFSIVEVVYDLYSGQAEYYYRYANEALASMLHTPLHALIHTPFFSVIPKADPVWRKIFSQCSSGGGHADTRIVSAVTGRPLRVLSYQPHFGFCACIILEDTHTELPVQETSVHQNGADVS